MSIYGTLFRVSTFGESHGKSVGCIIDGMPAGLNLNESDIQYYLNRRRPGHSILTTQRNEKDLVEILSGVEYGVTLGTPLAMIVRNEDKRKYDYANTSIVPRPGHADCSYQMKYGIKASSGGGRASARETIARVAAGAVAEKWLKETYGVKIVSWVSSVGDIDLPIGEAEKFENNPISRDEVDKFGTLQVLKNGDFVDTNGNLYDAKNGESRVSNYTLEENISVTTAITRCPHPETAAKIAAKIQQLREEEDSTGGIVTCVISGVPIGIGEPCFDKIEAELAKAMLSLPAVKGFEIGKGFKGTRMKGSEHNDCFITHNKKNQKVTKNHWYGDTEEKNIKCNNNKSIDCNNISNTVIIKDTNDKPIVLLESKTNNAGGACGGITLGSNIVFRVAIKPVSSIGKPQITAGFDGSLHTLTVKGRHDPCVLPRTPPLVEGMAALVVADMVLRQRARLGENPLITLHN